MHKMVRNARIARAWSKVHRAVWAKRRAEAVASWDGNDSAWVAFLVEDVWQARWAARAAR